MMTNTHKLNITTTKGLPTLATITITMIATGTDTTNTK